MNRLFLDRNDIFTLLKSSKMYRLKNKFISLVVHSKGAELQQLINQTNGIEYLWQANSQFWGRHAPVLFPIVGQIENNSYNHENQTFKMTQHGFARDQEFKLISQTEASLAFELLSNPSIKKIYPFDFSLQIGYELIKNKLIINYRVQNKSQGILPFSIGAHPGFRVPLLDNEKFEDYYLEFEREETLDRILFEEGLLSGQTESKFLNATKTLPLSDALFEEDALIFKDPKSKTLSIKNKNNSAELKVGIANFPYLGIWSPPGKKAPFVCIEPWYGIADTRGEHKNFNEKQGRILLKEEEVFECHFSLEVV